MESEGSLPNKVKRIHLSSKAVVVPEETQSFNFTRSIWLTEFDLWDTEHIQFFFVSFETQILTNSSSYSHGLNIKIKWLIEQHFGNQFGRSNRERDSVSKMPRCNKAVFKVVNPP